LGSVRNSSKFVEEGFIRLSAEVVNGRVQLSVADSGPGIPLEKQQSLFTKYQDSLDVLSQGTGIGLFLCKNITEILGGEIRLDNDYHSGIPGRPGCRFVIDLNAEPIEMADLPNLDSPLLDHEHQLLSMEEGKSSSSHRDLPERISVLFVDDDPTYVC
jgi:K+-sensing histidine kinase KdpD